MISTFLKFYSKTLTQETNTASTYMHIDKYAEIIHSRINHVQNLQSAISGLVITGCGILATKYDPTNQVKCIDLTIVYSVFLLLLWMHIFTIYQFYSVKKAVLVLKHLETKINEYEGIKYFDLGELRFNMYLVSHGAPSIVAAIAPLIACSLGLIDGSTMAYLLAIYLLTTILIVRLTRQGFRLNVKNFVSK